MTGAPVVFVDVDGVLAINRRVAQPRPMGIRKDGSAYRRPARHVGYVRRFDPRAVAALNHLGHVTGSLFVLSSSWRMRGDAREQLARHGVDHRWHEAWATDQGDGGRGAQITRWLAANGNPPHAILDDWAAELGAHALALVHVPFATGLNLDLAKRAALIITGTQDRCPDA